MKHTAVRTLAGIGAIGIIAVVILVCREVSQPRALTGPIGLVGSPPEPTHGLLGIQFRQDPATPLTVDQVVIGAGAEKVGIQSGDVVTSIQNHPTPTRGDFMQVTQELEPGTVVRIVILRNDNEHAFDVQLVGFEELVQLGEQDPNFSP